MASSKLSQNDRYATITTPLGKDKVVLDGVVIQERISQPFHIDADLVSEDKSIKFEDIIGQNVTIALEAASGAKRYFNGIVRRFSQKAGRARYATYRAEVVPWLWALSCNAQCRIFQKKTVPDILKEVLGGYDISFALGGYDEREYCVQYRETDLNFISRLMEEEGIYYFFRHQEGKHTMVIADSAGAHAPLLPEYKKMAFRPYDGQPTGDEFIYDWEVDKTLLPVKYAHTDYDFEAPKKPLMTRSQKDREHGLAIGEVYDYPGRHLDSGLGDQRARVRLEEIQAGYEVAHGKADARGVQVGFKFELIDHPRGDQNREYLVTAATHIIRSDVAEADGFEDEGSPYLCEFDATPLSEPYRAPRVSHRPFVQGPQTAVVVGPGGEEIYTDKHGRVKVQFHWDREGKKNEDSSCWVRVSHPWAGKGWGSVSIPRIGQEVVVDFLEGDPDSPIIVGRVYNGECTPPFGLPGKKMVSGVKSNSTPGGGGYNEISLDDTKGTEKIVIHGQYDMETEILHDDTKTVGNNETTTIGVDREVTVGKNHTETVGMNQSKTIGKSRSVTVGMDETINIAAKQSTTIGGTRDLTLGGSDTSKIGGLRSTTIGGAESLTVGGAMTVTSGAVISITAGGVITITSAAAMTISAGAALAITAPAILLNGRPVLPIPAPI